MEFDGLDRVDWSALNHAHGAATDVPDLLEGLCSADPIVRSEACSELFETVWHQGTIYPASAEILPFLFQIVAHRSTFSAGELDGQYIPPSDEMAVGLICSVATGETWLRHAFGIDGEEKVIARLEVLGRSPAVESELERETRQTVQLHLRNSAEQIRTYLGAPEGLGEIVAETLGAMGG